MHHVTNEAGEVVNFGDEVTDCKGGVGKFLRVTKRTPMGFMVEVKRSHAMYAEQRFAAYFGLRVHEAEKVT